MLPPVGTRGRPLRDLLLSPALGESQSCVRGVVWKERVEGGVDAIEVRGLDTERSCRAERRPKDTVSMVGGASASADEEALLQQVRVVKEERRDCEVGANIFFAAAIVWPRRR